MNGDLSELTEITEKEILKMIMHLGAKEVKASEVNINAYLKGISKLLSSGNFMVSLSKHVNQI